MLRALELEFDKQIRDNGLEGKVEILIDSEAGSIGAKRNRLLDKAWGTYVAFFDDDDFPCANYLKEIFKGIKLDVDCCSLRGIITFDGEKPEIFEHSLRYNEWATTNNYVKYERYPNHLNAIKKEIAKQFKFPEINHGEDHDWSKQVHEAGVLKTEYYISEPIYQYRYVTKKNY